MNYPPPLFMLKEALKNTLIRATLKLGLLLGLIVLFFWMLLYTHLGLRWVIGTVNLITPVHIESESSQGSLAGHVSFKRLHVTSRDFDLTVDEIQLNWHAWSLFIGTIEFDDIIMSGVQYEPLNMNEDAPAPSLNEIKAQFTNGPLHIRVKRFSARDLHFKTSTPITIDSFSFSKADTQNQLLVSTLVLEGSFGHLSIVGENEQLNVSFDLSIQDLSIWSNRMSGDFKGRGRLVVADLDNPLETTHLSASLESKKFSLDEHQILGFNLKIHGTLAHFSTNLKGTIDKHQVHLSLQTTFVDNEWKITVNPSQWYHPKYGKLPKIDGTITFNNQSFMDGSLHFNLFDGNQLNGSFKIDPANHYAITGNLKGQFDNFDSISKIFPEVDQIKGAASVELQIGGTLDRPKLSGEANFRDVHLPLADLGTKAYVKTLSLASSHEGVLDIQGEGTLGNGAFNIQGQTNFKTEQPTVQLTLTGEHLVLSDTPEYYIVANPNLTLKLENGTPKLTGTLTIVEANVQLEDTQSYIAPSSDVTIIQNKQNPKPVQISEPSTFSKLNSHITLQLGEKAYFKGYGLETKLEGQLELIGDPTQPLKATGKVHLVDGQYKVRGKKLTLTKASLIYSQSPLANPALDVRGQREIRNFAPAAQGSQDYFEKPQIHHGPLVVGLNLTGTLKSPVLKLFSTPHLSDGDILSYLLLDKPQSSASVLEGQLLFQAANELIFQFGSKTKDLRPSLVERFNLDKLELQSSPNRDSGSGLQDTVLVVGKQFSNRLYAEYSYGLINSASSVHLRYLVGKHMTLETSASRNSMSADLLFIFESG